MNVGLHQVRHSLGPVMTVYAEVCLCSTVCLCWEGQRGCESVLPLVNWVQAGHTPHRALLWCLCGWRLPHRTGLGLGD